MDRETSQLLEEIQESIQHWEMCRGLPIAVIVHYEDRDRLRMSSRAPTGGCYNFQDETVFGLKVFARMDQEVGTFQMLGEL